MTKTKTTEEFIQDAIAVHGDKYDYSNVIYKNSRTNISIICKVHGEFNQRPARHLEGRGCNKCSINQRKIKITKSQEQFIADAASIHYDRYDYSLVNYINGRTSVKIICKKHGSFEQQPYSHLQGKGCRHCNNENISLRRTKSTKQFIHEATMIHGNKYDYSKVKYIKNDINIKIICKKHGIFYKQPNNHLQLKSGCPKCTSRISKSETDWLDSLGVPNDKEHRQVRINEYLVDGFAPISNTVYEFYGDYWHGNPVVTDHTKINQHNKIPFKQLYEDTLKRETFIRNSGYRLISIWENDWNALKFVP